MLNMFGKKRPGNGRRTVESVALRGGFPDRVAKRKAVKIAVIDDQHFPLKAALERLDFRLTELGDIENIDQVSAFDIILCDIQGVGVKFLSEQQGAFVVKEIRRQYPEKFIVAFTGANLGNPLFKQAVAFADSSIRKDSDADEWVQHLDGIVDLLVEPRTYWRRIRKILVEADLDTSTILDLEDGYVRALEDPNNREALAHYMNKASSLTVSPELRAAALRVATSALIEVVKETIRS